MADLKIDESKLEIPTLAFSSQPNCIIDGSWFIHQYMQNWGVWDYPNVDYGKCTYDEDKVYDTPIADSHFHAYFLTLDRCIANGYLGRFYHFKRADEDKIFLSFWYRYRVDAEAAASRSYVKLDVKYEGNLITTMSCTPASGSGTTRIPWTQVCVEYDCSGEDNGWNEITFELFMQVRIDPPDPEAFTAVEWLAVKWVVIRAAAMVEVVP